MYAVVVVVYYFNVYIVLDHQIHNLISLLHIRTLTAASLLNIMSSCMPHCKCVCKSVWNVKGKYFQLKIIIKAAPSNWIDWVTRKWIYLSNFSKTTLKMDLQTQQNKIIFIYLQGDYHYNKTTNKLQRITTLWNISRFWQISRFFLVGPETSIIAKTKERINQHLLSKVTSPLVGVYPHFVIIVLNGYQPLRISLTHRQHPLP